MLSAGAVANVKMHSSVDELIKLTANLISNYSVTRYEFQMLLLLTTR